MQTTKVLVAGATGYLGHYVAKAFKDALYQTEVMVRNPEKFRDLNLEVDKVITAEITKPETLQGICDGIDIVFSSVGITRQKDGLTYHSVDYQSNLNLLNEAVKSGVKCFIYVSVFKGGQLKDKVALCREKERFVSELKASGIDYRIIRPTGYFSDMAEYLRMAKKGKVYIFGNGEKHINPIGGKDLSMFCVQSIKEIQKELNVGGPETFKHNDIASLAFDVLDKKGRTINMPDWLIKTVMRILHWISSSKTYGPIEFIANVANKDMVAPPLRRRQIAGLFCFNERFAGS